MSRTTENLTAERIKCRAKLKTLTAEGTKCRAQLKTLTVERS